MEQFMLIFHGASNPADYNYGGPEAMQAQMEKWFMWVDNLKQTGQYVGGEALLPHGRVVASPASVTDGPYTEGKEIVGGYFVIRAKDYDEAVAISKAGFPDFQFGGKVEVRQVVKFE